MLHGGHLFIRSGVERSTFAEEEIRLKGLPGGEGGGGWGVVGASYNVITATSAGAQPALGGVPHQVLPLNFRSSLRAHGNKNTHTRLGADLPVYVSSNA